VLEAALGSAGYRVTAAVDATDALALASTAPPDVVVADAQLPGVGDGYDLVAHLRQHPTTAATSVLLMTRSDAPVDRDRAQALGVAELLAKPVFVRELLAWIDLLVVRRAKSSAARALSMPAHALPGWTRDLPVVDLLQLFDGLHATGVVRLSQGDQRGEIHFRQGRAVDARSGRLTGEAAVYALVTWKDAAFELSVEPVVGEDVVDRSTGTLRMEGMRWVEEWERLQERLRPRGALVEADPVRLLPLAAARGDQVDSRGAIEPVAPSARVDSTLPVRRVEAASPSVTPIAPAVPAAGGLTPSVPPESHAVDPRLTPSVPPESHAVDLSPHVELAPAPREQATAELPPPVEAAPTPHETPAVDPSPHVEPPAPPEQATAELQRPVEAAPTPRETPVADPSPPVEAAPTLRETPAVDPSPRMGASSARPTAPAIDFSPRVDTAHAFQKGPATDPTPAGQEDTAATDRLDPQQTVSSASAPQQTVTWATAPRPTVPLAAAPRPAVAEPPVGEESEALDEPLALASPARTPTQEAEGASVAAGRSGTTVSPSTPPWTRELEVEVGAPAEEEELQIAGVPRRIHPRSKRIVGAALAAGAFICIAGGARALSLRQQRAAESATWHAGTGEAPERAASRQGPAVEVVPPPSAPSTGTPAGSGEPAAGIAAPGASDDRNTDVALAAEAPNGADGVKPLASPPVVAAIPGSTVPTGESVLPLSGPPQSRRRSALVVDAEQALLRGSINRAVELATKATIETPEDAEAWLALGAAHRAARDPAAAREDYRNCVAHAVTFGTVDCRVLGKP
jgi:CheY-like chemotaxis protein